MRRVVKDKEHQMSVKKFLYLKIKFCPDEEIYFRKKIFFS